MSVYEKFSKIIENCDADALIDCIAILDQKMNSVMLQNVSRRKR